VIITCISAFVIFFAHDALINLLNAQRLRKYLWLIPPTILIAGTGMALKNWNSRSQQFSRLSVIQVISSSCMQISKLTAGFAGYVSGGVLILTGILGSLISTLILGCQTWRDDSQLFKSSLQWKEIGFGIKRYKKFPLIDSWGAFLNVISWQMPVLLLSAFFTPTIVGFYALGATVLRMPINIIGTAIAQVFYQRASEDKYKVGISQITLNIYKRLVASGLFPLFMLCIIGQDLFVVVLGPNWIEAGLYIQILAPWIFFTLISSPLSMLFLVFERQGSALIIHSTIFLTRFVSLYIGGILGNVYVTLGLFSLVNIIVYSGIAYWSLKLAGISFYVFVATLFKYFCYFCPAALSLLFIKYYFNISSIISSSVGVLMICCYELVLISKDNDLRMYMKNNKVWKFIYRKAYL